ncbi:MAG: hypothetical protein FWE21_03985 [Defluviitaleaceae bacterium]|nr:hypothetical protein [Defluviitaleaceae bacterium]
MPKFIKYFTAVALVALMVLPATTVFAVRFGDVAAVPRGFWAVLAPYTNALDNNNSAAITAAGRGVINFWLDGRDAAQMAEYWGGDVTGYGFIINNIWSVSNMVARHYGYLGDGDGLRWAYTMAYTFLDAYQALTPHIGGNPDDMEFARTRIRNRLDGLNTHIAVFAEMAGDGGHTIYFGALHEPAQGILFGEQVGNATVISGMHRPSAVTIYVEFEIEDMRSRVLYDLNTNQHIHGINPEDYAIIQIAWNFLYEGATLANVPGQEAMVRQAARFLEELNLPILLRVGAEMDVWSNPANPQEFIEAFRFITKIMRQEAPNVAMVYSVNFISAFGMDWQMFYPGDDYVDWVGISLYTTRYFMGNPYTDDATAALRRTGYHANPLAFVHQLAEEFGDRKPLIITEGGVSLYNVQNGEDLTHWAMPVMRHIYSYIPLMFPQVKAMFWFNTHVAGENQHFHFGSFPQARYLYSRLTAQPPFIPMGQTQSHISFARLGCEETATMPANAVVLLTYVPHLNLGDLLVEYRLNGDWLGSSRYAPHRRSFDLSHINDGGHVITVRAINDGNVLHTVDLMLNKNGGYITIR